MILSGCLKAFRDTFYVEDVSLAPYIFGTEDAVLHQAQHSFNVNISARGNTIVIDAANAADLKSCLRFFQLVDQEVSRRSSYLSEAVINSFISKSTANIDEPSSNDDKDSVVTIQTPGRTVTAHSCTQQAYIEAIRSKDLVFTTGPAGTGKTFLAVACAVEQFSSHHYDRIILCRPAVEAGEKIGFLPGDVKDKVDPYMQPLYDALRDTLSADKLARLIEKKTIEIAPLAFMRGRTLKRSFIILDEAQNATRTQMKMFLTRLGEGSKMLVCGDVSQIDLSRESHSGLMHAVRLTKHIDGVGYVAFHEKDVIRHTLVRRVVQVYEQDDAKRRRYEEERSNRSEFISAEHE